MSSSKRAEDSRPMCDPDSWFSPEDIYLFREGRHVRLYEKLGAHCVRSEQGDGVHFAVWAPNASAVAVIGDFNGWNKSAHPLKVRGDSSGIWAGFIAGIAPGARYKYHITSQYNGYQVEKADPFAFHTEEAPKTASIVWDIDAVWHDETWMANRAATIALNAPVSVYEVHLGSWRRIPEEGSRWLSYEELAEQLPSYTADMGFTHVELMPLTEHPFYGSWGYQTTGYFAPTARFGSPQDCMRLIDRFHDAGIGVILDWVPSHFPTDLHGLGYFDGTHLFEHADPRMGYHPEWHSSLFNYGRNEVRSILISSALFWLDKFHIDGIRVDGVASMLYRDYARKSGEWIANEHGGRENMEAVHFLKEFNEAVYRYYPGVQTMAEESTAWPQVSWPTYLGGLGFGYKWNMGWMHDTLFYMERDPLYRKYHHGQVTFSIWYAFQENFILPLSHDEVVHGKGSLVGKMPGDDWQKFANLRLLLAYMYAHPGKKLLFMGGEFAQQREWNHDRELDWGLLADPAHAGVQALLRDLNRLYRTLDCLHRHDCDGRGFRWIDCNDSEQSVLAWRRSGEDPRHFTVIVCNFTPVPRHGYRIGVPLPGPYREVFNSDAHDYGGSGLGNTGCVYSAPVAWHGEAQSLTLTLPPLAALILLPPAA